MNWKHGTIFLLYRHTFSENELTDFIVKWHQQFYTPIEGTHFYMTGAIPDLYAALVGVHLSPCARGTTAIHVRTCAIDENHTEVAVIVATATRTFALALRLEEYRGRWMTTALELA